MASEPTRERFKQRTDPQGVRLVRTGMEEGVVLADIANAIRHHDLTLSELRAILDEGHPPASPVPSVEARMTNYALAHELMDTAQWVATLGYRGNADTHVSRIVRAVEHLRGQRYERPANLDDLLRNDPWAAAIASHVHSALRSEAEPSEDTDNADSVALEVLCRVFDDGADEGIEEWREWYGPAEWLHWSRALGAFIRHRLDTRPAARSSSPEDPT